MIHPLVLLGGIVLDLVLGDPRRYPHPVRVVGWLASRGQGLIQARRLSPPAEKWAGLALWLILVVGIWVAAELLLSFLNRLGPTFHFLAGAILTWNCLSLKDLLVHVRPVLAGLEAGDLNLARQRLSLVVGRETARLDRIGVTRAGLETLAESLADGVAAPLLFLVLGGPALGLAYKAVNTLDSMLGYKFPPFTHVGFWPAKLDDAANFGPARLTWGLLVMTAWLAGKAGLVECSTQGAWRVGLSEHGRSSSPNAGWPEAALAGALGVSLLGPAAYSGHEINKPYINHSGRPPEPADLRLGLRLVHLAGLAAYALALILALAGRL